MVDPKPGLLIFFGSGETSASARAVYDYVWPQVPPPIRLGVLETPAGFEPNSEHVAGRVAEFIREHLHHLDPQVAVIPARKRGTPFSPDDPAIVAPLWAANMIFLGPGSPTYAVRQLDGSLAWHVTLARQRLGAALILASAAVIAAGAQALPVYEIFKVGEDLHWVPGLNLLGAYGLHLVWVSHWNNREGGAELDTSRCFMGQERFTQLLELLPSGVTVVGIDEYTALVMDLVAGDCRVMGAGGVTVLREGGERHFEHGVSWPLVELGPFRRPEPDEGIPRAIWAQAQAAQRALEAPPTPSKEVLALVQARAAARAAHNWPAADQLRQRVLALGWQINDTPAGPDLGPVPVDQGRDGTRLLRRGV